jgi:hypothetical protein
VVLKHSLYCPQYCLSDLQIVGPLKNAIKARKFNSVAEGLKVRESSVLQERHIIIADSVPFMSQCLLYLLIKTRLRALDRNMARFWKAVFPFPADSYSSLLITMSKPHPGTAHSRLEPLLFDSDTCDKPDYELN